jgi:TctA family transporter
MLFPVKIYFKDRWILGSLVISGLFFGYTLVNTIRFIRPTSEQMFLHYNIIFGIDLIGEWWKLYLMPAAMLVVIILNFIISYFYYRHNRFISRYVAFSTAFIGLMFTIASNLIVGLNT